MSNPKDFAKFVGRSAVLEYATTATGSGPAPQESDWKPGGAIRSKSFDLSPNTVTSEADDAGGFPESLVTNSDLSISVEGEFRKKDKEDEIGINALIKLYVNAVKARTQPTVWVRLQFGSVKLVGNMVITALSSEAPTNDLVTFSAEFKVADASSVAITTS
ncbi:phage tail protein [Pasteurella multocida]|uniref:phage tail tube protein n=1 Tax=Pasteurella multocida TaxID=747 RepID=UPI002A51748A|nr:phage tail protein [Pasteurella multocida]MDY0475591.1 phage tail protein [Pasteurella multocida]MDY0588794.1 phage tail protein [Pasteurella multocida]MDY0609193.1 phage tail protein [Pasteurella multocida]MDY0616913.1 phage tail protein [Pasteurella multocida]